MAASSQELIQMLEEKGEVTGMWPPKIRRQLKDAGYLVLKNESSYTVCKTYKPLEGKTQVVVSTRIPKTVIKFYLDKGLVVQQEKHYKIGCGYPSDAWDICDCYDCRHDTRTPIGYLVTIKPVPAHTI